MSSTLHQRRGKAGHGTDNQGDEPLLVDEGSENSNTSQGSADLFFEVKDEKLKNDPLEPPAVKVQSRFDRLLANYVQYMSSPLNQDKGLKLLQWTLWLVSTKLSEKKRKGLYKFYLELSFVRYALRLYGFPEALQAARTGAYSKSNSRIRNILGKVMAWSMVVYFPLEHAAYVQWKAPNVFPVTKRTRANTLSAWSCRAWLIYILAEVAQGVLSVRELYRGKDDDESVAIRNEKLQIVRSLLFTLPCLNWSLPKWDTDPWLREGVVNSLLWAESVVCIIQSLLVFKPAS